MLKVLMCLDEYLNGTVNLTIHKLFSWTEWMHWESSKYQDSYHSAKYHHNDFKRRDRIRRRWKHMRS